MNNLLYILFILVLIDWISDSLIRASPKYESRSNILFFLLIANRIWIPIATISDIVNIQAIKSGEANRELIHDLKSNIHHEVSFSHQSSRVDIPP